MQIYDSILISQYTSLALLFALIVTGAWRKSFTNTALVIAMVIFSSMIILGCVNWAILLLVGLAVFTTIRAILHSRNDEILRGINHG